MEMSDVLDGNTEAEGIQPVKRSVTSSVACLCSVTVLQIQAMLAGEYFGLANGVLISVLNPSTWWNVAQPK